MKVKSTLKVINQKSCKGRRGVTDGQTYQRLVGWPEVQVTDRVRLGRATYKPGTYEYFCSLHPEMRGNIIAEP